MNDSGDLSSDLFLKAELFDLHEISKDLCTMISVTDKKTTF